MTSPSGQWQRVLSSSKIEQVCIARLSSTCGGGMILTCGGLARRGRRFRGLGCLAFLLSNKPFLSNRLTFTHMAARGRCRRYEICAAVLVVSSVQLNRVTLRVLCFGSGTPPGFGAFGRVVPFEKRRHHTQSRRIFLRWGSKMVAIRSPVVRFGALRFSIQQNADSESFNEFGPASRLAAGGVACVAMTSFPTDFSR